MKRMKPTAYKIGEGERKGLSKDMQEIILAYEEENELLKQCLDEMMFKADVINITIHGELGDYVYVRSDKQLKLNVEE